jgi:uncharacterized protein
MKTNQTYVFRVKPEKELVDSIQQYCKSNGITSAVITGIIGSLKSVRLGFLKELPGKFINRDFQGPLEIVCAQGTVATCQDEPVLHIHILVSDENRAIGGHLTEARVFSTAEIVITTVNEPLKRKLDDYTGLKELEG